MHSPDDLENATPDPMAGPADADVLMPEPPPFPGEKSSTDLGSAEQSSRPVTKSRVRDSHALHLATSTFMSLMMVLALLLIVKWMVPSMVESIRYSWHRGQLRAEYDHSGGQLSNISLKSIEKVSELVSRRVGPTVVHINILNDPFSAKQLKSIIGLDQSPNPSSQGSGFIISSQGYVLTNYHVIEGDPQIEITLSDGRVVPAEIVGSDPLTDLAVLSIEASGLMAAEWGDSDQAIVGSPVWGIGSPFGFQHSLSFGIVSGKHRVDFRGNRDVEHKLHAPTYGDLMQTDVVLHPGNSGGPLVNSQGQVVGVNAAILGDKFQGISFSIPSNIAQQVASDIIHEGSVSRGWLGVRMEDLPHRERYADGDIKPGVLIKDFPEYSPAEDSGLRVDDLIVQFHSQSVLNLDALRSMIVEADVGQTVDVVVLRGDQELTVKVKLGRRPPPTRR